MSLSFPNQGHETMNTIDYKAKGSQGEEVVVQISKDVFHKYGESTVQRKASEKYERNELSNNMVIVTSADFP
jgi:hypothetical protein